MTTTEISDAIGRAIEYLRDHPSEAKYTDSAATAILEDGLRVVVTGPDGANLTTDMPKSIGGRSESPSPGWFLRAAQASCLATLIGMEAARAGVALDRVEIIVDSESDDYGILGIDDSVPAGPLTSRARVRIEADARTDLRELMTRADRHCPVTDAVRRAVPWSVEISDSET
jgi:organic hydroperoxide reductase OsmC/OhrA